MGRRPKSNAPFHIFWFHGTSYGTTVNKILASTLPYKEVDGLLYYISVSGMNPSMYRTLEGVISTMHDMTWAVESYTKEEMIEVYKAKGRPSLVSVIEREG